MALITPAARIAALAAFALLVSACDHGGAFVVDNRTDQELVARVTGSMSVESSSGLSFTPRQDQFTIPPGSALAVAVVGFADDYGVGFIDILTSDCKVVATFGKAPGPYFSSDGQVIEVDPGPTAHLRKEFPETGTLAATTDRCSVPTQ